MYIAVLFSSNSDKHVMPRAPTKVNGGDKKTDLSRGSYQDSNGQVVVWGNDFSARTTQEPSGSVVEMREVHQKDEQHTSKFAEHVQLG